MTRMISSTRFSAGDVVRVLFTFTSQGAAKVRPAVVLSSAAFHASRIDLIMMPLTTKAGGYFGDRPLRDWRGAGLPSPSILKAVIQTIPQSAICGHFGRLSSQDLRQVKDALADIIDVP
jgi:mRNA-degrading endonuclease toxin of MazEF toxin-antitoxin module